MADPVYRYGQVEWAIWTVVRAARVFREEPPRQFSKRLKNLLSHDRGDKVRGREQPPALFAFSDVEETLRSGNDEAFSLFNAFCLLLAIQLENGLTRNEAVLLIRYCKPALREHFTSILAAGPGPDGLLCAAQPPMRPGQRAPQQECRWGLHGSARDWDSRTPPARLDRVKRLVEDRLYGPWLGQLRSGIGRPSIAALGFTEGHVRHARGARRQWTRMHALARRETSPIAAISEYRSACISS